LSLDWLNWLKYLTKPVKQPISTTLEVRDVKRLRRLARLEATLPASLIRKCILRALPDVEREILGRGMAGDLVGKGEVAA